MIHVFHRFKSLLLPVVAFNFNIIGNHICHVVFLFCLYFNAIIFHSLPWSSIQHVPVGNSNFFSLNVLWVFKLTKLM